MQGTLVIEPWYSEGNLPLWLSDALQDCCILWLLLDDRGQGCEHLLDSLKELLLVGVTGHNAVVCFLFNNERTAVQRSVA